MINSAFDIDYTNVEEICGYQTLLCKIMEREGGLNSPPVSNAVTREVKKQGQVWLREVKFIIRDILEGKINSITLASIPDLINAYDFVYRITNGGPCYDYLLDAKLQTVKRWLKGDKSITVDELTLMLYSEIERDIRSLEHRFVDFALSTESSWIDELKKYGQFKDATFFETYRRLAHILGSDLFAYLGSKEQQKVKTQWAKGHILPDDTLKTLNLKDLKAYIGFSNIAILRGCYPGKTVRDFEKEYRRLATLLVAHPDLNRFFRQALEIDLTQYVETLE